MAESISLKLNIEGNTQILEKIAQDMRAMAAESKTAGESAGRSLDQISTHASAATRGFRDLRRSFLLLFAAHEVIDFTGAIVNANVELQRIQYTLEAVTGSAAGAQKEFDFISETSKKLGLDLQTTAAGYSRLAVSAKSAGLTTDQVHDAFLGLADTFTVLHTPATDVNGLLVQLEQGLSLGKFQMQDFRAIAQHLPGTMELAKQAAADMGGSLEDMLKHGGVPAQQFFIEFANLLRQKFEPEVQSASHGLNAAINRIKTTVFGIETGRQTTFVDSFTNALNNLNTELNDPGIQKGLSNIISGLGHLVDWTVKGASALGNFADALGRALTPDYLTKGNVSPNANTLRARLAADKKAADELEGSIARLETAQGRPAPEIMRTRLANLRLEIKNLTRVQDQGAAAVKRYNELMAQTGKPAASTQASPGFSPVGPYADSYRGLGSQSGKTARDVSAQAQATIGALKAQTQAALAQLDATLKAHTVSLKSYYAERVALQQKAIDDEIAALKKELAAAETTGAKRTQIEGKITALEAQRSQVAIKGASDQTAAEKKLNEQLDKVRVDLLKATGDTAGAAKLEIEAQYADLIKQLEANGDTAGVALVHKLINTQESAAQLAELENQFNMALSQLQAQEQSIQAQITAGLLTPTQGQDQIVDLQRQFGAATADLIPQMDALAAGNKKAEASVAALKQQYQQATLVVDEFKVKVEGSASNALAQFFDDIRTGTKSASGAWDDMLKSFSDSIAQFLEQKAATALVDYIFSLFSHGSTTQSGGSTIGFSPDLSSSLGNYSFGAGHAAGGLIRGAGTSTSDSIPARLSDGEYVVRAAAVKHWGVGFLSAINASATPNLSRHFANGGLAVAGAGGDVEVNVINQSGGPVETRRRSSGHKEILDVIVGAVADDIQRGGRSAQTLQTVFGLRRVGRGN